MKRGSQSGNDAVKRGNDVNGTCQDLQAELMNMRFKLIVLMMSLLLVSTVDA